MVKNDIQSSLILKTYLASSFNIFKLYPLFLLLSPTYQLLLLRLSYAKVVLGDKIELAQSVCLFYFRFNFTCKLDFLVCYAHFPLSSSFLASSIVIAETTYLPSFTFLVLEHVIPTASKLLKTCLSSTHILDLF